MPLSKFRGKVRLTHPMTQNFICGMILFCLPGLYLALTGLGAGGGKASSQSLAANVNVILHAFYFALGWFGGTVLNMIGPSFTICLGSIGYSLYTAGLWYFDRTGHTWFAYLGGAIEGCSAAMLWSGVGYIAYSYSEEKEKAKYVGMQWTMLEVGASFGSLVALLVNMQSDVSAQGAPNTVYIIFVVIQLIPVVVSLTMIVRPQRVVRSDGTHIAIFKQPSLKYELQGLKNIFTDWKFLMMLPAIASAETALTVLSSLNGYWYNLRTRSLNNFAFNFIQIPSSLIMIFILDKGKGRRKTRALTGLIFVAVTFLAGFSAQTAWIVKKNIDRSVPGPMMDWTDPEFTSAFVIYVLYATMYSTYQACIQYLITAMTNDPERLARYAGIFRGTNALGIMINFLIDGNGASYVVQVAFQYATYGFGLILLFYIAMKHVVDTNYFKEETVIVPEHLKMEQSRTQKLVSGHEPQSGATENAQLDLGEEEQGKKL